ncbi:probable serine/threonine-protein kinase nek3 isoform X2 [Venturia canescens]|uniref:probable serine/threonine-protein kinase nek3 isoform X2 n=1 Tax=Venturia canescens TaxID=32260 RepID=UPI001C9D12BA|nr:probable serine/threonine-protein kinase nek3 isoform X2 [Venturia canescens]
MALVTVQRSPSVSSSPQSSDSGAGAPADDDEATRTCKSLSECYFAGKGAALVLPPNERARPSRRVSAAGCDIQQHLQSMFYLLRPEETLKMAVKLESVHPGRTRYLVVVSCTGRQDAEESCLLGIDCHTRATVGLVLRVLADTAITLDGDGGFSVSVCGRQHIFKPVSVQAMWSALQTLHKVSSKAREQNYFLGGLSHDWVSYYEQRIESDRSCLNEWHAMDNLESRRPPSPDSVRNKPREREETERVIRATLKEIMMSVDLDEVTSKYIRGRLEEDLDMDLGEFKPFIDQEMLVILGQMDAPTEIFDHVYLGSEWNASNLEELQKNGVRHILNVTREIDNFFPGMFDYLNVRVYDDEKTDLLKHWDDTFKYITKAKKEGSKVLVHCKMGVSRSASVVIAYAMKAYNWDFSQAWKHVKDKRNCIKPNNSFLLQLETYQGILDAMKNKEKLQRSKSETNLKLPSVVMIGTKENDQEDGENDEEDNEDREEYVEIDDDDQDHDDGVDDDPNHGCVSNISGIELKKTGQRPKSWSPSGEIIENVMPLAPFSQSLESIDRAAGVTRQEVTREELLLSEVEPKKALVEQEARNVLMPCCNGQSYSVSQNQIVHLPGPDVTPSVKNRVSKLETQGHRRRGLVLNLTNQFEAAVSKPASPESEGEISPKRTTSPHNERFHENGVMTATTKVIKNRDANKSEESDDCLVWTASTDSTEYADNDTTASIAKTLISTENSASRIDYQNSEVFKTTGSMTSPQTTLTAITTAKTSSTTTTTSTTTSLSGSKNCLRRGGKRGDLDPFSSQLDRVFDREERRGGVEPTRESPSRQSSWSSYDSAVVLENNSVHSSWATLPSRNSSWGSYDMRPSDSLGSSGLFPYDKEEIPWHPGTVKRTKQKLEESNNSGTLKRRCTTSGPENENKVTSRLSIACSNDEPTSDYNPVLLHYTPSPTPRRRDSPGNNEDNQNNRKISSPESIDCMDISSSTLARQLSRLSTSAPLPSSLSTVIDEIPTVLRTCRSESETSSPSVVNTTQCSSVKHHKMLLENLTNKTNFNKRCLSVDDSPAEQNLSSSSSASSSSSSSSSTSSTASSDGSRNISGMVKNLKKEFEAKSSMYEKSPDATSNSEQSGDGQWTRRDTKIVRSLPSSPVIAHSETKIRSSLVVPPNKISHENNDESSSHENNEDLSVRVLVGKYEISKSSYDTTKNSELSTRSREREMSSNFSRIEAHPPARSKIATEEFTRRSAPIVINHQASNIFSNDSPEAPGRPPVVPTSSVVVASVVAKAASKKQQLQQHGRTHPLARLQVRPRHNSPVYNTM